MEGKISKIILILIFLTAFGLAFNINVPSVKAVTVEELKVQIAQLQAQIATLQQELAELLGEEAVWCHDFNVNLRYGDSGVEAQALQAALEKEGFYKREITGYFDEYTASAVTGFQEKYKEDVLAPWGLEHGTGYVGTTTRAKLNELYGCEEEKPSPEPPEGEEIEAKDEEVFTIGPLSTNPSTGYGWQIDMDENYLELVDEVYISEGEPMPGKGGTVIFYFKALKPGKTTLTLTYCRSWECEETTTETKYYEVTISTEETCHTSPLWGWNYCSSGCKCKTYLGDCDTNADCYTGYCAKNVGEKYGQVSSMDVCEEKKEELSIEITNPKDGETVSETTKIEATANSTNELEEMYLTIEYEVVGMHTAFTNCVESAEEPIGGGLTSYSKTCWYDWTPSDYEGKVTLTVDITDVAGNEASDSVIVTCKPEKKCIQEGKIGYGANDDVCCSGLTKISNSWPSGDVCVSPIDTSFVCSYCGNDVCGLGENWCNCSEDCETTENLPPVVDGLTAPTQLKVNEQGMWTIKAHDPESGPLTYAVDWGDEYAISEEVPAAAEKAIQTTTFTHSYSKAGTYTIAFTITDDHQQSAKTSSTVKVIEEVTPTCTDSDGGKNYYVKGTTKGIWTASGEYEERTDSCDPALYGGRGLSENYCYNNSVWSMTYDCPYGCKDGACLSGITVLSPNGGEKLTKGKKYNISWKASCEAGKSQIYISLSDSRKNYYTYIDKNPTFSSSGGPDICQYVYSWTIPDSITTGENVFKVRVESINLAIADESDNYFSIVSAPFITVLSPNGGEEWTFGEAHTIRWSSEGVKTVKLFFCIKQTGDCYTISGAESIDADKGSYKWTISGTGMKRYVEAYDYFKIKAQDVSDPSVFDLSDDYFSLDLSSITVISPNGGEEFVQGFNNTISWETENLPDNTSYVHLFLRPYIDIGGKLKEASINCKGAIFSPVSEYVWDSKTVCVSDESYEIDPGDDYKIQARLYSWPDRDNPGIEIGSDYSDDYFSIVEEESCHIWPLWAWDYCSLDCKCYVGEGDCDSDADCYTGYCAQNVGEKYGQNASMDVCEKGLADLTVTDIEFYQPQAGETPDVKIELSELGDYVGQYVTAKAVLVNQGQVDTGGFNVKWFLDGTEIGYGGHANLPAGDTSEGNVRADWQVISGIHTLRFQADVDNHVIESNENNNSFSITVRITEATGLENIETHLASVSHAISQIAEIIKELMGR